MSQPRRIQEQGCPSAQPHAPRMPEKGLHPDRDDWGTCMRTTTGRTHHGRPHKKEGHAGEEVLDAPQPPLQIRKLLRPARPPICALPAPVLRVEGRAPESALIVCEDGDPLLCVERVRGFIRGDVLREAVDEEDGGACGGGGGVGASVDLEAIWRWEPRFGVCGSIGHSGVSGGSSWMKRVRVRQRRRGEDRADGRSIDGCARDMSN